MVYMHNGMNLILFITLSVCWFVLPLGIMNVMTWQNALNLN